MIAALFHSCYVFECGCMMMCVVLPAVNTAGDGGVLVDGGWLLVSACAGNANSFHV